MTNPPVLDPPAWYRKWAKGVGVVVVTMLTAAVSLATNGMQDYEWVLLAGQGVSAASVALVPNLNEGLAALAKSAVAFLLNGLTVLAVVILDGLTAAELSQVLVAALAAIGVTALPNQWPPARLVPVQLDVIEGSSAIPSQAESRYPPL